MTTTDKTGEQLVQSIRKTKATGTTHTRSTTSARSATSTAKAKPAPRTKSAPSEKAATEISDLYQRGRRVWPD